MELASNSTRYQHYRDFISTDNVVMIESYLQIFPQDVKQFLTFESGSMLSSVLYKSSVNIMKFLVENHELIIPHDIGTHNDLTSCRKGDDYFRMIEYLIDQGMSLDYKMPYGEFTVGQNIIQWASSKGNTEMIKLIVDHGIDPTLGDTFIIACSTGSINVVQYLLEYGVSYDHLDQGLAAAVISQKYDMVKFLLESGANPNNMLYPKYRSRKDVMVNIVDLLIDYDADILNLSNFLAKMIDYQKGIEND